MHVPFVTLEFLCNDINISVKAGESHNIMNCGRFFPHFLVKNYFWHSKTSGSCVKYKFEPHLHLCSGRACLFLEKWNLYSERKFLYSMNLVGLLHVQQTITNYYTPFSIWFVWEGRQSHFWGVTPFQHHCHPYFHIFHYCMCSHPYFCSLFSTWNH